jgi:hypothetical protein
MAVGSFLLSFISPSARKPSRSRRTAVEDPEEETAQVANG